MIDRRDCYMYLIELYFKANLMYKFNDSKLKVLITIFALCYMKSGVQIEGFKINKNDLIVSDEDYYGYGEYLFDNNVEPENGYISKINYNLDISSLPGAYRIVSHEYTISESEKELLRKIFLKFGNYPTRLLLIYICEFFKHLSSQTINYVEYIDESSVKSFFEDDELLKKYITFNGEMYANCFVSCEGIIDEKNKVIEFLEGINVDSKDYEFKFDRDLAMKKLTEFLSIRFQSDLELRRFLYNVGMQPKDIEECYLTSDAIEKKYIDCDENQKTTENIAFNKQ